MASNKNAKPGQVVWGDVRTGEFKVGRRSKHRTPVGRVTQWNADGTADIQFFAPNDTIVDGYKVPGHVGMKNARIK